MKKTRVGIVYGGRSGEHEVSIASAASIFKHLDRTRYEPVSIRIDKDGRWILGAHPRSHFEYRVRVATPEGARLYVMDRMFTEASGRCWIVDYKVSLHEGGGAEAFLDRELERYAPQLARYVSAFSREAPRAALYFPLMGGWRVLTDPAEVRE